VRVGGWVQCPVCGVFRAALDLPQQAVVKGFMKSLAYVDILVGVVTLGLSAALPLLSHAQGVKEPQPYDVSTGGYIPSGFMGDGTNGAPFLELDPLCSDNPDTRPFCTKVSYKPGALGWTALAWQFPENNWGEKEGRDLSGRSLKRVKVRARGATGREVVQFKAGGCTAAKAQYPASFVVEGEFERLSKEWKTFTLNVKRSDLSNVPSALTLVFRKTDNPGGATVFIDDITYVP
jgi:hypothetical protein